MSLEQLARKYKTDKLSHGFIKVYEKHFLEFKDEEFNFLEIGVFFGSSIKMWNDFFSKASIYGIDTFKGVQGNGSVFKNADKYLKEWQELKKTKHTKIELRQVDQSSEEDLKQFANYCKEHDIKFKIILDDGSHLMRDQQISFFHLFDLVENGGIYVIEDLHSSDQSSYDVLPDKSNSTKKIFLNDMKTEQKPFRSIYINDNTTCNSISKSIKNISDFHVKNGSETLFIHKK